jgi:hypothetical protein
MAKTSLTPHEAPASPPRLPITPRVLPKGYRPR